MPDKHPGEYTTYYEHLRSQYEQIPNRKRLLDQIENAIAGLSFRDVSAKNRFTQLVNHELGPFIEIKPKGASPEQFIKKLWDANPELQHAKPPKAYARFEEGRTMEQFLEQERLIRAAILEQVKKETGRRL